MLLKVFYLYIEKYNHIQTKIYICICTNSEKIEAISLEREQRGKALEGLEGGKK